MANKLDTRPRNTKASYYLKKIFLIAATLLIAGIWMHIESNDPYKGFWIYRTFFQKSFNADITVKLEFDGKPYSIHRIVKCIQEAVSGQWGNNAYAFLPEFYAFGIKTSTGEGLIINTPAVCSNRSWTKGGTIDDWQLSPPVGFIPLISVANNADDPTEIIVYASRQAYKSPLARLKYISTELKPAPAWQGADHPDKFAAFSPPELLEGRYSRGAEPKRVKWRHIAFVKLSRKIWDDSSSGLALADTLKRKLYNSSTPLMLSYQETLNVRDPALSKGGRDFSDRIFLYGKGLLPGPLLDGSISHWLSSTMYFDEMVPYRLKDNVWVPVEDGRGQFILTRSDTAQDNRQYAPVKGKKYTHLWESKISFDGEIIDYKGQDIGGRRGIYEYAVYLPATETIFLPMGNINETYRFDEKL